MVNIKLSVDGCVNFLQQVKDASIACSSAWFLVDSDDPLQKVVSFFAITS
jgi:hypothetical protein